MVLVCNTNYLENWAILYEKGEFIIIAIWGHICIAKSAHNIILEFKWKKKITFFCVPFMAVKCVHFWKTDDTYEYVVKLQNKAIYSSRFQICHIVPQVAIISTWHRVNCDGLKCGQYPINIVKRPLLRSYRLLQVERVPCRARISKTGRQVAESWLPPVEMAAIWRCVLLIKNRTQRYNSQICVSHNFWFDQEAVRRL